MGADYSQLPLAKDSPTEGRRKRRAKATRFRSNETREKAKVRKRDGAWYCRLVPNCDTEANTSYETAHIQNKGMGGDHGLRTTAETMVRSCSHHHRGVWSLHSGHLRVEYLTDQKANGPIAVHGRLSDGSWIEMGRETSVGVWART